MRIEKYRPNQSYIYVLTTIGDIVVYEYKYSGSKGNNGNDQCNMLGRIQIPADFSLGQDIAFDNMRGSLIL